MYEVYSECVHFDKFNTALQNALPHTHTHTQTIVLRYIVYLYCVVISCIHALLLTHQATERMPTMEECMRDTRVFLHSHCLFLARLGTGRRFITTRMVAKHSVDPSITARTFSCNPHMTSRLPISTAVTYWPL